MTHSEDIVVRVFIGLGSNLNDPEQQVKDAIQALVKLPLSELIRVSKLYRSAPLGPENQPDYINAVAALDTRLTPLQLLTELHLIEHKHGRVRDVSKRWGPRTLDLDILTYADQRIKSASLQLPHPGIAEREFVLYPWLEIAPDWYIPDLGAVRSLAKHVRSRGLRVLEQSS